VYDNVESVSKQFTQSRLESHQQFVAHEPDSTFNYRAKNYPTIVVTNEEVNIQFYHATESTITTETNELADDTVAKCTVTHTPTTPTSEFLSLTEAGIKRLDTFTD
jgi:hypothetical protein